MHTPMRTTTCCGQLFQPTTLDSLPLGTLFLRNSQIPFLAHSLLSGDKEMTGFNVDLCMESPSTFLNLQARPEQTFTRPSGDHICDIWVIYTLCLIKSAHFTILSVRYLSLHVGYFNCHELGLLCSVFAAFEFISKVLEVPSIFWKMIM